MFYLILAMMLVLFYIFVAPSNVKGTMNLVASVFLLVALVIAIVLGFLRILQSPPQLWLGLAMVLLGYWALRDIYFMDKPTRRKK
ncbi:DUF3165 family protein [Streptococcus gallolyticus]|uniref:DUF3165 family protein n=1 Tax=Streptococcus hepaticus TaxID=3349163 RepID=UPI001C93F4E6|nr:DUF3165 family protein [Streptococcus gallolyticus]MBY5041735.1 DUF3165 family protein [Streptococcus gallolyticus]